jgi:hypothetical protein
VGSKKGRFTRGAGYKRGTQAGIAGDLTSSGWEAENENPRFCGKGVGDAHTGHAPSTEGTIGLLQATAAPSTRQ